MGFYVFRTECLIERLLEDAKLQGSKHDFGGDIVPRMITDEMRVYGHRFDGYWRDVGTIQSYHDAHMELLAEPPALDLYDRAWPIHTKSEERPPGLVGSGAHVVQSLISHGCRIHGHVERSVLSPGVLVEEGAIVRDSIVLFDAAIGAGAVVDRTVIDKEVVIGPSAYVGFGDDVTANQTEPGRLNTGITLVGQARPGALRRPDRAQLPDRPRRRARRLHARRPPQRLDRDARRHRAIGRGMALRVLHVAAEVAPYSKVGGLADVAGSLPIALASLGVDCRIVTPRYRGTDIRGARDGVTGRLGRHQVHVHRGDLHGVEVDLVECPDLYERATVYGEPDDGDRFALLARAGLAIADDWGADIVHAHDWHGALAPILADGRRTILTIHNLAYQGHQPPEFAARYGLAPPPVTGDYGPEAVNLLGRGIAAADRRHHRQPHICAGDHRPRARLRARGAARARTTWSGSSTASTRSGSTRPPTPR